MKQIWMFPGQGSQTPGMARHLLNRYPEARRLLEEASGIVGNDLYKLCIRGPLQELIQPEVAEPIIAATQIAYAMVLMQAGFAPRKVAGYSAGEIAACFAAGVISASDAVNIAAIRGRILQKYVDEDSCMVSIMRVDREVIERQLEVFQDIEIAAINADDHFTLVGNRLDTQEFCRAIRSYDPQVTYVDVAGRWHSRRLATAAAEILEAVRDVPFRTPVCSIYCSATGARATSAEELKRNLAQQVALPVRWQSILQSWWDDGDCDVLEIGTGKTLLGMLRRNWKNYAAYCVDSVEATLGSSLSLEKILALELSEVINKKMKRQSDERP